MSAMADATRRDEKAGLPTDAALASLIPPARESAVTGENDPRLQSSDQGRQEHKGERKREGGHEMAYLAVRAQADDAEGCGDDHLLGLSQGGWRDGRQRGVSARQSGGRRTAKEDTTQISAYSPPSLSSQHTRHCPPFCGPQPQRLCAANQAQQLPPYPHGRHAAVYEPTLS